MYCIINQNRDIIAGDKEFFTLLHTESLMELYGQMVNGDISISFGSDDITIAHLDNAKSYPIRMSELNGLLSQANIIEILPQEQGGTNIDNPSEPLHAEEDRSQEHTELNLDEVKPLEHVEPVIPEVKPVANIELTLEEDKPLEYVELSIEDDKPLEHAELTIEEERPLEHTEHTGLALEENNLQYNDNDYIATPLETIQEQTTSIDMSTKNDGEMLELQDITQESLENDGIFEEIEIDIPSTSQHIGLSQTDYAGFLEEYIQTSQSLKADLTGSDEDKKQLAINFIVHLSDVLCLPANISNVVSKLSLTPTSEHIDKFYNVIAKIKAKNQPPETISFGDTSQGIAEEREVKEIKIESEMAPKKVRSINLSDIAPVKFDFILDEAVRELSLPSDIVKEFITYFIEQSHTEIDTILDAYEEGDVEKVKRTAHLLKGVASNLYIVPLAESLFELQYNEDIEQVEPLVKKYWAQFISFENLMNNA